MMRISILKNSNIERDCLSILCLLKISAILLFLILPNQKKLHTFLFMYTKKSNFLDSFVFLQGLLPGEKKIKSKNKITSLLKFLVNNQGLKGEKMSFNIMQSLQFMAVFFNVVFSNTILLHPLNYTFTGKVCL